MYEAARTVPGTLSQSYSVIAHAVAGIVKLVFREISQRGLRCDSLYVGFKFITV